MKVKYIKAKIQNFIQPTLENTQNKITKNISLLSLLVFLFFSNSISAKVADYTFSQSYDPLVFYSEIAGGTVLPTPGGIQNFNNIPLNFTFKYNNINFTNFSVNSGGFIALGSSVQTYFPPISNNRGTNNIISAIGATTVPRSGGELRYELTGVAPNRVMIIQWKNFGINSNDQNNFQIKLHETSNEVELEYGNFVIASTSTYNVFAGLRGNNNADFNSRQTTTDWSVTTATTANNGFCRLSSSVVPSSGLKFFWTPPADAPMTFVSSTVTQSSTANVLKGTTENQIIRLEVVTADGVDPAFDLISITLNSNGSSDFSNDVSNIQVYYTGFSPLFANTTLFASALDLSAPLTGITTLYEGSNYFWVTYDVPATATVGNYVDAECLSFDLSLGAGSKIPDVTAPLGERLIEYCQSKATNATRTNIGNVTFGSLYNGNPFPAYYNGFPMFQYSDFTSLPVVTFFKGDDYNLEVYSINSTKFYSSYANVFIDYDRDGAFDPIAERIFSGSISAANVPASALINIPLGAASGLTRMRVILYESANASTSPCATYSQGETEDYKIEIKENIPCSDPPNPGIALVNQDTLCSDKAFLLSLTGNSFGLGQTYQWETAIDNINWIDIPGATSSSYSTTQSQTSFYRAKMTCGGSTLSSTSVLVVTKFLDCYCTSNASNSNFTDIGNVTFGSLNNGDPVPFVENPTAVNLYSDFTALPPETYVINSAYPISISQINSTNTFYESWTNVFIDYNQDGIFDPVAERVFNGAIDFPGTTLSGNVIIPANAKPGQTRMRVMLVADGSPTDDPCGPYFDGETEDYIILLEQPVFALDVGAIQLTLPLLNQCYGANEEVKIEIKNFSDQPIDFSVNPINLEVTTSGANPQAFPLVPVNSSVLNPLATMEVLISSSYNMSLEGVYLFDAKTILPGDGYPTNDPMKSTMLGVSAGRANASYATICTGSTTTLSVTGQAGTIQWQRYDTGSAIWLNETGPGNSSDVYDVSPTSDTQYRAFICVQHPSNVVDVQVLTNSSPSSPTITAGGPTTFCQGGSVVLTSSNGASYTWQPGGLNSKSITVSQSGEYYVTTTNGVGCTATSSSVSVQVNSTDKPTITQEGTTLLCPGETVTLTSSAALAYNWRPGGANTQSVVVSNNGKYTVTATDANGCQAESDILEVKFRAPDIKGFEKVIKQNCNESVNQLYPLSTGEYLIIGSTTCSDASGNFLTIKLDQNLDQIWSRSLGKTNVWDLGIRVCELPNGNYYATGITTANKTLAIEMDPNGVSPIIRAWEHGITQDRIHYVMNTLDNQIMQYGALQELATVGAGGRNKVTVLKKDGNLVKQWGKYYDFSDENVGSGIEMSIRHMIQLPDSSYAILAFSSSFSSVALYQTRLIKIDKDGNILWIKGFHSGESDNPQFITSTSDGGFAFCSRTKGFGAVGNDVMIIKTDGNGVHQWTKRYGGPVEDYPTCIIEAKNGNLLVCGETTSFGDAKQGLLIRLEEDGNLLWAKTYGGANDETFKNILPVENGYYLAGSSTSFNGAYENVYLIKTDETGEVGTNCQTDITPLMDVADGTPTLVDRIYGAYDFSPFSNSNPIVINTSSAMEAICGPPICAEADFHYDGSPFCEDEGLQPPVYTCGGIPGTFSSQPAGLALNTTTGEIDISASTVGVYVVSNVVPAVGDCPEKRTTTTVIISAVLTSDFSYEPNVFCVNATGTILPILAPGSSAGVYSTTPGLVLNSSTGEITLLGSLPGNYIITNTIPEVGCPEVSSTATIDILAKPSAEITNPDVTMCKYDAPHNFVLDLLGIAPWTVEIENPDATTRTFNCAGTPCNIAIADSGCYILKKVSNVNCFTDYNKPFCLHFYDLPTATMVIANGEDADICPGETVDIEVTFADGTPPNYGFTYQKDSDPAVIITPQVDNPYTIAGVGSGTYTLTPVSDDNCLQAIIGQTITITEHPLPTLTITNPEHSNADNTIWVCQGDSATITLDFTQSPDYAIDYNHPVTGASSFTTTNGSYNLVVSDAGTYTFTNIADIYCADAINKSIKVGVYPNPTMDMSVDNNEICLGDDATLTLNLGANGPYEVNVSSTPVDVNFIPTNLIGIPDGHQMVVSPKVDTEYKTVDITDVNGCSATISKSVPINVHDTLALIGLVENCNGTNDKYVVTVTLSGGDANTFGYNNISPTGLTWTFDGIDTWTSDLINIIDSYDVRFFDRNGCNTIIIQGAHACNCITDAGTMNDLTAQDLCLNQLTSPTHLNDWVNDVNDIFTFALSTKSVPTSATDIVEWKNNGIIDFDSYTMTCGITYYLMAVSGNDLGNGEADFTDPCFDLTQAIPVTWRCNPDASFQDIDFSACIGSNISTNVLLTPNNQLLDYGISAPGVNRVGVMNVDAQNFVMPANNLVLALTRVQYNTAPACPQTINKSLTITALDSPTLVSKTETCNSTNDAYVVTLTLTGGDASSYAFDPATRIPAGLIWTFDGIDTWTSDPINSGIAYEVDFFDNNNCAEEKVSGQKTCNCTTDAGTMNDVTLQTLCIGQNTLSTHLDDWVNDLNDIFIFGLSTIPVPTISNDVLIWSYNPAMGFDTNKLTCGTTYYLVALAGNDNGGQVDFNDACLNISAAIPVTWRCNPDASLQDTDFSACVGSNISTNVLVTPNNRRLDYLISAPGVSGDSVVGVDAQNFVMPASNVTLTLTRVQYNTAPNCPQTINKSLTITALDSPTLVSKTETCNSTNDAYVVTLTLTGGDASSYAFDPATRIPAGLIWTFDGIDTWTSDPITSGVAYEVDFFDGNNCGVEKVSGQKTCNCSSNAGTVDASPMDVCEDVNAITSYDSSSEVLDGNDMLEFILHDGIPNPIGNILSRNTTGVFAYNVAYAFNTIYYITAVVGNNNAGQVDLNDPCLSTSANIPVTYRQLPTMTMTALPNDSICLGDTAELEFIFPTGIAPFAINGTGEALFNLNSGHKESVNPTVTTSYVFTSVTDAYCSNTISEQVTITLPLPFVVTPSQTAISCYDVSDGVLSVAVTGGYGNYSYQWYNSNSTEIGSNQASISNLGPDDYSVVISDHFGCAYTEYFTLNKPPLFDIDLVAVLNEICFQDSAGELRVEAPNGIVYTVGDPMNLPWQNDSIFFEMHYVPGTNDYLIRATDVNGCMADTTIDITGLTPMTWLSTPADRLICSNTNTTLQGQITGGNGTYTYVWDDVIESIQHVVNPSQTTTYSVYAKDKNDCPSAKTYVTVSVPDELSISTQSPDKLCVGGKATLNTVASGGAGAYEFLWTNLSNGENHQQASWEVEPTNTTSYEIKVTDSCGTVANKTLLVEIPEPLVVQFNMDKNSGCAPLENNMTNTTVGDYQSITWDFGDTKNTHTAHARHTWNRAGEYVVSLSLKDQNGCAYQNQDTVEVYPNAIADFEFFPHEVKAALPNVQLRNYSIEADSYTWTIDSIGVLTEREPHVSFPMYEQGNYKVCLLANNEYQCPDELCKYLFIDNENMVFVPNFFTPNSDGINDGFKPVLSNERVTLYDFMIFDRWGELLFSTDNLKTAWDATFKGILVQNGSYTWRLKVRFEGEAGVRKLIGNVVVGR
jgi:gliding motility-associated-like protein